jgi:signal transduction histidine kinase
MSLIASIGHLTLAVLSLARGQKSAISLPLALLCFDMFGICFAPLARSMTDQYAWSLLDSVCTAMAPPLVLHLTVVFVGARRAQRAVVALAYAAFGGLAISSLVFGRAWCDSGMWHAVFLAGWVPLLVMVLALLIRHLVREDDAAEKARTRTMLGAFAVGAAFATLDELSGAGLDLPRLAPIGLLGATFLMAAAAFRFRLFDRELSGSMAAYAGALALAVLVAYVGAFRLLGGNVAALSFATVTVTLIAVAAAREVASSLARDRARASELATLGRFSNQMAHDLKNPLATLKGALQFLKEERARGNSLDGQHEFLDVMLDQVDRLRRVVDDYQRIGRVEPVKRAVDVNEMVKSVLAMEPFAATDAVTIESELARDLPRCELDSDLVSGALENLIKNAFEAMPKGGNVLVKTARADDDAGVILTIEDGGEGMDARKAERAFDEFYTTKATGSGLGLAFVRRVAEAHGGAVTLRSKVGAGTVVEIRLPSAPQARN